MLVQGTHADNLSFKRLGIIFPSKGDGFKTIPSEKNASQIDWSFQWIMNSMHGLPVKDEDAACAKSTWTHPFNAPELVYVLLNKPHPLITC